VPGRRRSGPQPQESQQQQGANQNQQVKGVGTMPPNALKGLFFEFRLIGQVFKKDQAIDLPVKRDRKTKAQNCRTTQTFHNTDRQDSGFNLRRRILPDNPLERQLYVQIAQHGYDFL
jgi:hypothetical protein